MAGGVRTAGGLVGVLMGVFLAGCDDLSRWQNRYGPDPKVLETDVAEMAARQNAILAALESVVTEGGTRPPEPDHWYRVAQAGFLYVDEKCDTYLTNMFKFDRERDRIKGTLTIIDKGVGAILSLANNDKNTIGIVAQAFGIASGVTDVIGESYLFKVAPGIVTGTVDKLRDAYWQAAADGRDAIRSPTAALASIRGYLQLCLPPYIEAQVAEVVARSTAGEDAKPPSRGAAPAAARARSFRNLAIRPPAAESPRFRVRLYAPARN